MSQSKTLALGACTAAVAAMLAVPALAGCSTSYINGVPANHFTDSTGQTIEANHQRCGACHEGANRGNLSFEYTSQLEIIQGFNNGYPEGPHDTGSSVEIIQQFNMDYMDLAIPYPAE